MPSKDPACNQNSRELKYNRTRAKAKLVTLLTTGCVHIRSNAVVFWMNCRSCGELIDEFDERWPDEGFENPVCKACDPRTDDDDE